MPEPPGLSDTFDYLCLMLFHCHHFANLGFDVLTHAPVHLPRLLLADVAQPLSAIVFFAGVKRMMAMQRTIFEMLSVSFMRLGAGTAAICHAHIYKSLHLLLRRAKLSLLWRRVVYCGLQPPTFMILIFMR